MKNSNAFCLLNPDLAYVGTDGKGHTIRISRAGEDFTITSLIEHHETIAINGEQRHFDLEEKLFTYQFTYDKKNSVYRLTQLLP